LGALLRASTKPIASERLAGVGKIRGLVTMRRNALRTKSETPNASSASTTAWSQRANSECREASRRYA